MEVKIIKNFKDKDEQLVDENFFAPIILVITETGEKLGELKLNDALKEAEKRSFDLVCVAPNAKVPVCRMMDYAKFRFEMQKKKREARKNQKVVTLKEVRISPVIGIGDYQVKLRNAKEFLQKGHRLKLVLTFVKRMRMLSANAGKPDTSMLDKFLEDLKEIANVEQAPTREGRNITSILVLKK